MGLIQEQVTVEKVTQYGFRANGVNYGLSPKLKEKNITPEKFVEGSTYLCEIWVGPKGGKSVNSFIHILPSAPPTQLPPNTINTIPAYMNPPAIPQTTVSATLPPGGVPPVTSAKVQDKVKDTVPADDKMSKADWAEKDRRIGIDAVIKSSLESPGLAQLFVGKNVADCFTVTREFIKFNLETQALAKNGVL
jgi:hypothetical protein